jgi:glyoxylase-like metal-dependent hydrolase (beta-lactamase superfamily II)
MPVVLFSTFAGICNMEIDCLVLGLYETNCYVLREESGVSKCLVIDTGLEPNGMLEYLTAKKLQPAAVVLTHGHADHIGGVEGIKSEYPETKIYVHRDDEHILTDGQKNLSFITGCSINCPRAEVLLKDGDILDEAQIKLRVLHTPGHSPGGISLYSQDEQILFSGDTLFAGSIGRTDFPGGDMPQLVLSIKERLFILPDATVVYPGHGPKTTIGQEKKSNPFVKNY